MAGHWRSFEESKDVLPFLMYDAVNDSRTRPHHLALDGVIKPVGDVFWKTHACPNGHRCRCSIRAIDRDEARERGGVTQNVPAEGAADKGWGHDPRGWGKTLGRLIQERQSACRVDSAQFGRKHRPVGQNVDCTPWGAKMLDMLTQPQSALIVEFSKSAVKVADKQVIHHIGAIENQAEILIETGINVAGFDRILDNYAVRHVMKKHGDASKEAARGQIAVTLDDFGLIALIVGSPDKIYSGGLNRVGRETIIYTKLIDGVGYLYVEELRTGRLTAAADSMRKKKGAWGAP